MWPTRKRWKKWICSVWGRWRGSGVTTCQCKTELLQRAAKGRDRSRGRSLISKATPTLSSSNFCSTAWQGQPCYRKRREWQWDGAEQAVQSMYGSPGTSPIASMSSSHTHTLRSASLPSEALPSPLISWQPSSAQEAACWWPLLGFMCKKSAVIQALSTDRPELKSLLNRCDLIASSC